MGCGGSVAEKEQLKVNPSAAPEQNSPSSARKNPD